MHSTLGVAVGDHGQSHRQHQEVVVEAHGQHCGVSVGDHGQHHGLQLGTMDSSVNTHFPCA